MIGDLKDWVCGEEGKTSADNEFDSLYVSGTKDRTNWKVLGFAQWVLTRGDGMIEAIVRQNKDDGNIYSRAKVNKLGCW